MLKHASLYYYEQIFNYIHNILINVKFKSKFHIRDMNFAYFLNIPKLTKQYTSK